VIVKVCAIDEFENVKVIGALNPPPDGVIVIVPEIAWPGVIVKTLEAMPTVPLVGPVRVYVPAETWYTVTGGSRRVLLAETGLSSTIPVAVGVMVKVWEVDELENVFTTAVLNPPPEGVIVMVLVIADVGVMVNVAAVLTTPVEGPVMLYCGVSGVESNGPDKVGIPVPEIWYTPLLIGNVGSLAIVTVIVNDASESAATVPIGHVTVPVPPAEGVVQPEPVVDT
jgi:hypothetical protein